jgi:aspartate 1-decarboxylase
MFSTKLVVPALAALLSVTAAQTSSICSQATATINSQADATAFASCATISGSVVVSSSASGVVSIDGPQQITGDLTVENAGGLTSFGSTSLGSIGGTFTLTNLTLLSTLSFGDLTSVKTIAWTALPALSSLTFPSTISKATSVTISNTFLSTLDGINLDTVSVLEIDNNNRLTTFSTQVANITSSVNINANGNNLVVSFPNLIWAANMTFRNVSSVSIPSLATINGSLGFYGNYMTNIAAPNLTSVGSTATGAGSYAFVANAKLANISMPLLATVGGAFQIANNTGLTGIDFPALTTVGGAIDFSGNFSTPLLPALNNVKGGFNVQSTAQIDCSTFDSEHSSKIIQGTYTCKTTADATSIGGTTGTTTGSSASATSSKGAAVSFGVSEAVAGLSVIGGLLQMFL